jgi:hypothetical protein
LDNIKILDKIDLYIQQQQRELNERAKTLPTLKSVSQKDGHIIFNIQTPQRCDGCDMWDDISGTPSHCRVEKCIVDEKAFFDHNMDQLVDTLQKQKTKPSRRT